MPTPVRVFLGPLCILSLAACATSEIAEPVSPVDDAVLRTARSTTPGYTALNLAPLPGHSTASAEAVNDAGVV
ncbi:MAG TPA: hypothetical protein VM939_13855, partial [Gemmatimonadaceae bacterium]|nr:hypothetical protein [Gemmatimonadaceae bacterium]